MGQNFYIFNVDKHLKLAGCGFKFGEWLFTEVPEDLLLTLGTTKIIFKEDDSHVPPVCLPFTLYLVPSHIIQESVVGADSAEEACLLLSQLSEELLDLIFSLIPDVLDVFCFAATCLQCWRLAQPQLARLVQSYSWQGDRLISLGAYTRVGDYPTGFKLTPEEIDAIERLPLNKEYLPYDDSEAEHDSDEDDVQRRYEFITLARLHFEEVGIETGFDKPLWNVIFLPLSKRMEDSKGALGSYDEFDLWRAAKKHFKAVVIPFDEVAKDDPSTCWVLRNLDTREYVRSEAVEELRQSARHLNRVTMGHVLVCHISWSCLFSYSFSNLN